MFIISYTDSTGAGKKVSPLLKRRQNIAEVCIVMKLVACK